MAADPMQVQQQAQAESGTDQEWATVEQMQAGLMDHLYGKAREGTIEQLRKAKNPAAEAGRIVFLLVQEGAKQAEQSGIEFDLDMLLGVATGLIESLYKMAIAAKVEIEDEEMFMAEALFTAVQTYVQSMPPGSEEQEAAKAMLADMQSQGLVQEGAAEVQRLGQKAEVDPFAPQEKPMAAGVRVGLMGGGNA